MALRYTTRREKLMGGFLRLALCLTFVLIVGCAAVQTEVRRRAYIVDAGSPWKIAYGNISGVETDYLTHGNIGIWVDLFPDTESSFIVLTKFEDVPGGMEFTPSRIRVGMDKGSKMLQEEGWLSCSDKTQNGFRALSEEPIPVNKKSCYYFKFAQPLPPIDEEIVVYLNDSLRQNGVKTDVPPVAFRKTIKRKVRLGLAQ